MNKAAGFLVSVAIFLGLLAIFFMEPEATMATGEGTRPFREMLWNYRSLDLIGQMMIIMAGTFGVLVLTKERIER
ncbi:MAG: hypothetical protein GF393_07140 [Armatimonadia bacterium]|nr:hypothetical protein [Armatimonadia bacterium]